LFVCAGKGDAPPAHSKGSAQKSCHCRKQRARAIHGHLRRNLSLLDEFGAACEFR
jgi:hypothetical protein